VTLAALSIRILSVQPRKRVLQLEAVAHIEVQKAIDEGKELGQSHSAPLMRCGCIGSFAVVYRMICYGCETLRPIAASMSSPVNSVTEK
jgi:hypothetical protein